jgi:MFS family permease
MKYSHPLWVTLCSLKGNQKACVFTEPLWAIPNNLFLPLVSIYMAAVGLQDKQIGMVTSFGLAIQLIWGLFSGAIADKYGRRRMMLVFGLLSWTIPCMLWAAAQGYPYFMLAVFFNSMWQVTGNCFSCMIVEDGDSKKLVNIYTILSLTGLIAGFISPVAGFFIDRFTLVPTMRVIYMLSMVMMTIKFILQYRMASESDTGKRRIKECKGQSVLALTFGGWGVIVSSLQQPRLFLCVIFMALLTCFNTIQITFWPLFITTAYGVSDSMLSVFPLVTSITSILVYMLVTPHINILSIQHPLLAGLGLHMLGLLVLLACLPIAANMLWVAFLSAICEALALALLGPLCEAIMSIVIPAKARARTNSLIFAVILLISTPVGWIAGYLSQNNRALPMIMNLCLIFVEIIVSLCILHVFQPEQEEGVQNGEI